jgi:hypothetical protein
MKTMNKLLLNSAAAGMLAVLLSTLVGCGGAGGADATSGAAAASLFANWTCAGSGQCSAVMGAPSGSAGPFATTSECNLWCTTYIPGHCNCSTTSSGTGGNGAAPANVSDILNGPNAAGQTSFWQITGLGYNSFGGFTKLALFADGTGKLVAGTNNCQVPLAPTTPPVVNQVPLVSNFTWTQTGASALLIVGAEYHCTFDVTPQTSLPLISQNGPVQSMSSITGGVSTATLHATIVEAAIPGTYTGTLAGGSF